MRSFLAWQMTDGTYVNGSYWQGGVDTYGIFREIDVSTGYETDTLFLLEYEQILNVEIVNGGTRRWVPHNQ